MGADQSSANGSASLQGIPTLDDAYLERVRENMREPSVTGPGADNAQELNTETSSPGNTFVDFNEVSEVLGNMQEVMISTATTLSPQSNDVTTLSQTFNAVLAILVSDDFKETCKKTTDQYRAAESTTQKEEILNAYTTKLVRMGMAAGLYEEDTNNTTNALIL